MDVSQITLFCRQHINWWSMWIARMVVIGHKYNVTQQHIDHLEIWVEKWEKELNLDKCEVWHFGRSNVRGKYV